MSRVFNVSHHKCGTTSVHRALELLGFKSHHCTDLDYFIKIYLEGCIASDLRLSEDNTAWNDLPFTLMYRGLYEAFPNETFLFVRRNPLSWVESVRQHITSKWSGTLAAHTLAYGYPIKASNFDARVCLRAYDRTCQDILEFFSGKKNFHLIEFADLSWETLCPAVGKPKPGVPFSWENKTAGPP